MQALLCNQLFVYIYQFWWILIIYCVLYFNAHSFHVYDVYLPINIIFTYPPIHSVAATCFTQSPTPSDVAFDGPATT